MLRGEQSILEAYRARERRSRLLDNLEEMSRADQVPTETYELLRAEYTESIAAADKEVSRSRQVLVRQLVDTRAELAAERARLEYLEGRFNEGSLKKSRYREAVRGLEPHVSTLEGQCERLQALLAAHDSSEIEAIISSVPNGAATVQRPGRPPAKLPILLALAAIAVIGAGYYWAWPRVQDYLPSQNNGAAGEDSGDQVALSTGERVDVASEQLTERGGAVQVSGTGTPLDGLKLELPQAAFSAPVTFQIGYSPIEHGELPDGVQSVSPLVHVDTASGEYAQDLLALTVPVHVPDGHYAMGFIYDDERGTLLPLPTIEESDGSLTVMARHFCPIVMLSAPRSRFLLDETQQQELNETLPPDLAAGALETDFRPGKDTWNHFNAGSCAAVGGYCHGMTLTSLYYYEVEKRITDVPLWKTEYANGLPEGMGTPGFWQDDRWVIELCSEANGMGNTYMAGGILNSMRARVNGLLPEGQATNHTRQFYNTAFAMYVTRSPQLIDVRSSSGGGHSLLCYKIDGRTLYVADPNFPSATDRKIEYKDGKLGPYSSHQNAVDAENKEGARVYNLVDYGGDISLYNLGTLSGLWRAYEAGCIDTAFPPYLIKATEINEQGVDLRTYDLNRGLTNRSSTKRLRFELDAAFTGRMTLYEYGSPPRNIQGNEVELQEGDNYIGFHIEEEKPGNGGRSTWWWAGFDWVDIYLPGPDEEAAPYSCNIEVTYDCYVVENGVRSPEMSSRSVSISADGWLADNTFAADYVRDDGVTAGHILVNFDPELLLATHFEFWEEDRDGTYYSRSGASGSGLEYIEEFSEPSEGFRLYWWYERSTTEPIEVTKVRDNGAEEVDRQNFTVAMGLTRTEPQS